MYDNEYFKKIYTQDMKWQVYDCCNHSFILCQEKFKTF